LSAADKIRERTIGRCSHDVAPPPQAAAERNRGRHSHEELIQAVLALI
jgi:hypothetical protein